jgi:hypothetical protein
LQYDRSSAILALPKYERKTTVHYGKSWEKFLSSSAVLRYNNIVEWLTKKKKTHTVRQHRMGTRASSLFQICGKKRDKEKTPALEN